MGNQAVGPELQETSQSFADGTGYSAKSLSCASSGRCRTCVQRAKSGELGTLEAEADLTESIGSTALPDAERSQLAAVKVAGSGPDIHEAGDAVDFDQHPNVAASPSEDIIPSHRRPSKRTRRRLLVTHTMEMRPSSALQLIIENSGDVSNSYDLNRGVLGKGAFGVEINIMKSIDHPNLLMLNEIFEDQDAVHLVLELCEGGDLAGRLAKAGRFSEMQAASTMQQIFRAVFYLHNHQLVHRDLKEANCLIATAEPIGKADLKVSDFGLSCRLEPGHVLVHIVGTPSHMAPEVVARKYTQECDLWSCGVIAYHLLCGVLPFRGGDRQELFKRISLAHVNFGLEEWLEVSQNAVALVIALLTKDPKVRWSPQEALSHCWFAECLPSSDSAEHLSASIIDDLRKFRRRNKLKRAALHVIASMMPEAEMRAARRAFISLDLNGDGLFSITELKEQLRTRAQKGQTQTSPSQVDAMSADLTADGLFKEDFAYTEFLAATFDRRSAVGHEGLCRAAFSSFDKNGDGEVSIAELHSGRLLGQLTEAEIAAALKEIDTDGDANMNYEEFLRMMRASTRFEFN
mmetsp:Transcript_86418/g.257929  ORF Transcript_86418/g.257929 Transcript_86418/m.257929 type:complete len:575 (-) Transcript_86418:91-1815(-)